MDRADSGNLVFVVSEAVQVGVVGGVVGAHSTVEIFVVAAVLLVVPAFVVAYLIGKLGLVYGLVLGVLPAIYGLSELPTEFFGLSRLAGAVVLFFVYAFVSGLSGVGGQYLARWLDAA